MKKYFLLYIFIFFLTGNIFSQKQKSVFHLSIFAAPAYSYRYFYQQKKVSDEIKNYRAIFNSIEKPAAGYALNLSIDYNYKRFGFRFGTTISDYAYSYSGAVFEYYYKKKLEFFKYDESAIQHRTYQEFFLDMFYTVIKKKKIDMTFFIGQCSGKPLGESISLASRGGVNIDDKGNDKYYFFYTFYLNNFFSGSRTGLIFNLKPSQKINLKFEAGFTQTIIGGTEGYTGNEFSYLIYSGIGMRYFLSGK